ncbi:Rho GTPase, putative [Entamoeba invadens IP1]|uniref:small monomeric GTPase n=1 Tax=Entamoeba invadens IP1 TaxID=370355 RepID=A0A0A1U525_ENTIV|nr:Rho GTPase, putative [Entamoeba invadens IP1]ELP89299.1 Rho GTPase, putative [Entamoeba invadens IP1]|eukprot:XP_004256070.1 Rho GTPase, putative [Entamoeba invadens IP1]
MSMGMRLLVTCFIIKYVTGDFPNQYIPNVFDNYPVNVTYNNIHIDVELWDICGQEEYPILRNKLYYPNTTCFILCFSLVYLDSFGHIKTFWLPEIRHFNQDIPILLVGLQSDLRESTGIIVSKYSNGVYQRITTEQGLQMAKEIGANGYIECSSMNDFNLNLVIHKSIKLSYKYLNTHTNAKQQNEDCIMC